MEKCTKCGKISDDFETDADDEIVCSTCMKNRYIKMNIMFSTHANDGLLRENIVDNVIINENGDYINANVFINTDKIYEEFINDDVDEEIARESVEKIVDVIRDINVEFDTFEESFRLNNNVESTHDLHDDLVDLAKKYIKNNF